MRHRSHSLYLIGILLLALIIRLIALNQSFWLDEAAQAVLSQNPFTLGHFNADFQPPLFYYFAHFWMKIYTAEWFLRLPSVFFGVATVFLITRFTDKRTGLIAAMLLATAPFHVYYSQEFRMYSLLTFLALLSWYFLKAQRPATFALITLTALFTHYFAFVNLAVQLIYIACHKRVFLRKLIAPLGVVLLVFAFWLPTLLTQIQTSRALIHAWPTWASVSNTGFLRFPVITLAKFTVGMISPQPRMLYAASVGIFALICLYSFIRAKGKLSHNHLSKIHPAMWMCAGPLLLAWVGGIWVPAASPWRVQFVLPALYLLIAESSKKLKFGTIVITYLLIQNFIFTGTYLFNPAFHREDWRGAVEYTDQQSGYVVSEYTDPFAPIAWYTKYPEKYRGGSSEQKISAKSAHDALAPVIATHQPIIVYSYLFEISDPQRLVEQEIVTQRYRLQSEKDFRGVGIMRRYETR